VCRKMICLVSVVLVLGLLATNVAFGLTFDIRIAADMDDFEQHLNNGDMDGASTDLELAYEDDADPATDEQVIGLRFVNIPIRNGTQVTSAYVEFEVDSISKAASAYPVNLIVEGELTPNAAPFLDATNNITDRTSRTTAKVKWSIPAWTAVNAKWRTPNISVIIQEIVNQAGWTQGNAVVLIFRDDKDNPSRGLREAEAYEGEATAAPLLHVEFVSLVATQPTPADGAPAVTTPLFQWTAGDTASFHDVYFGTNPTPGPGEFRGRQTFATYFHGPGLIPKTTYYWRIDEVEADGTTVHTGDVWSFTAAPLKAYDPYPPDGFKCVTSDVVLAWSPGATAITHDVYFGTNKNDVTNGTGGTFKGNQPLKTFSPGTLLKDTTYYWRIDEVEADKTTKHTGDVWSFKTLPDITISDPNLVGWWKFDEGYGSIAYDWSGHGNDGRLGGDPQWVEGILDAALDLDGSDYVAIDGVVDDITSTNITLSAWVKTTQGSEGNVFAANDSASDHPLMFGVDGGNPYVYDGSAVEYPPAMNDGQWHLLTYVRNGSTGFIYVDGVQQGTYTAAFDFSTVTRWSIGQEWDDGTPSDFYRGMVDDVRIYKMPLRQAQIVELMRGDPLLAWRPKPANKSTPDIEKATPLGWTPGDKAAQHDVYFGADQAAVANATTASTGIYRGRQLAASYTPAEALQWGGGPYYWRIDEYNTDGTTSAGKVWSFTIADYLIVDDFEDYTDDVGSRIFQTWKDGWGFTEPAPGYPGNGTGSAVGYTQAPFAELSTVHGGSQAMPLAYDNTGTTGKTRYSETVREWAVPQDLTRRGVKALTLYFYGAPANAPEGLYVALEDNAAHVKVVNHPDPEAVQGGAWQEWNIDLAQFSGAGVNLAAIKKMYIGLGSRTSPKVGGTGTIFIDDIRLYRPRCVPSIGKPAADLSGNCIVEQADVDVLANLWLDSGFQVTPVDPGTTGLVAYYPFNGNTNDTVGGHNGTTVGLPTYTTGKIGQAIQLDGVDDYVNVGSVGISGAAARTVSGWAKAYSTAMPDWTNIFGFTGTDDANLSGRSFDIELRGGQLRFCIHVYGWEDNILPLDLDWHHLAATYDGTMIRWYGDGRYINSFQRSGANALNTEDTVHMGRRGDTGEAVNFFPGKVDDVKIWNRALTTAEIAWLAGYTSPLSIPADLHQDNVINFKDFAVLADSWLEQILWP